MCSFRSSSCEVQRRARRAQPEELILYDTNRARGRKAFASFVILASPPFPLPTSRPPLPASCLPLIVGIPSLFTERHDKALVRTVGIVEQGICTGGEHVVA